MTQHNDRELLERAAKAIGKDNPFEKYRDIDGDFYPVWNPLTDDGDALRLAVKLKLSIDTNWYNTDACWYTDKTCVMSMASVEEEPHNSDPYAATRRAIVRAAAAIGKGTK